MCHNMVVVIHEMHEFGIEPTFGPQAKNEEWSILKLPGVR
jgi:hypothetical protein